MTLGCYLIADPLPVVPTDGKSHVVIDSTGVKVYGEGEWKTQQHDDSKRRTWRKLHLAVDEATGEILSAVVTDNSCHDSEVLSELLDEIAAPISRSMLTGLTIRPLAMTISKKEAQLRRFHRNATLKSGSTAIARHRPIREMRISERFGSWAAPSGNG